MSRLGEEDAEPTLQVSPGALLSDQPRGKEARKEKRKGGGLSLGRTKPRELAPEKTPKKGKHVRSKSGSRTPPDSPRLERVARGGKSQPSPNVKSHRKRYSQLGLNLSSESDAEEEEEDQMYFTNQAAAEASAESPSQEPFFSIKKDSSAVASSLPTSPGRRATVQFPVQFGEMGPAGFPAASLDHPPPPPAAEGVPQSPTNPLLAFSLPRPASPLQQPGPWNSPPSPPATLSEPPLADPAAADLSAAAEPEDEWAGGDGTVPDAEWRVSKELWLKCRRQFLDLQPTHGKLQGDQARSFFIQSRLPNTDLSAIWRLADIDHDNALSEQEFCVAMKLVLLRRKGYKLPASLPDSLKSSAGASQPAGRGIPPVQASQSMAELPLTTPHVHPSLFDISQHSQPELAAIPEPGALLVDLGEPDSPPTSPGLGTASPDSSALAAADTSTVVEREEPRVATIISLVGEGAEEEEEEEAGEDGEGEEEEDDNSQLFHSTGKPARPPPPRPVPSVRRAKSLKQFTPPPAASENTPPASPFSPPSASMTAPIISLESTPKPSARRAARSAKDRAGYLTLSAADEEATEEGPEKLGLTRERGHARSSSLDLNKIISGSSVHSDMPAAEPPRPPPKPVNEDLPPQVRGRSASTGSISSMGPSAPPPAARERVMEASANTLLLSAVSHRPVPARKAPLLPPVPKPRRPPPPRPELVGPPPRPELAELQDGSLLRNKSELLSTIRSLKDTNATLQVLNRELEDKMFGLMEERVQLAREMELAHQMQTRT